jgi:hypothetical protein
LATGTLADIPLDMLSHVLPVFPFGLQLFQGPFDSMVPYHLIMSCGNRLIVFLGRGKLFVKIEMLLSQW